MQKQQLKYILIKGEDENFSGATVLRNTNESANGFGMKYQGTSDDGKETIGTNEILNRRSN